MPSYGIGSVRTESDNKLSLLEESLECIGLVEPAVIVEEPGFVGQDTNADCIGLTKEIEEVENAEDTNDC